MLIDVNAARSNVEAWDLVIQVDGVGYRVREMTLEEFSDYARPGRAFADQEDIALLQGMFVGDPKPDVTTWNADRRDDVFTVIGAYLNAFIQKKRTALRGQVDAAASLTGATKAGRSTSGKQ